MKKNSLRLSFTNEKSVFAAGMYSKAGYVAIYLTFKRPKETENILLTSYF